MFSKFNLISTLFKQSFSLLRYSSSNSCIVLMRGMDYDTSEDDVIGFFKPLGITPKKIDLKRDGSGRTAGFSEVEFNTHAEAVVALRKRSAFIGNRFIRLSLKPSDESDVTKQTSSYQNMQSPTEVTSRPDDQKKVIESSHSAGHFVRMKNMPWRITDQDIFDFFYPVGVCPISVQPVYNESGIRIGEFDVQFLSSKDVQKAVAKNNAYLRNKFVQMSLNKS